MPLQLGQQLLRRGRVKMEVALMDLMPVEPRSGTDIMCKRSPCSSGPRGVAVVAGTTEAAEAAACTLGGHLHHHTANTSVMCGLSKPYAELSPAFDAMCAL